jgi:hypothetical protein
MGEFLLGEDHPDMRRDDGHRAPGTGVQEENCALCPTCPPKPGGRRSVPIDPSLRWRSL